MKGKELISNKKLNEWGFKNPVQEKIEMRKIIKGEKSVKIEDGKHTGIVTKIDFINTPYEYTHIYVKVDNTDNVEIKLGLATKITENTELGKLLERFTGQKIEVDKDYDIEEILKDKKVQFLTITEDKFANIVPESFKPI